MSGEPNLKVFDTSDQLAIAAAELFVACASESQGESNRFCVALSGGKTPKQVYELLATDDFQRRVNWSGVHLFFGDERAVPPDHPESNFKMVDAALISKVAIPGENVHRIKGELEPEAAAGQYEATLRFAFAGQPWPLFDLVFLGLGEDGHTASLFPGSEALREQVRWVAATRNPETQQERITLTLPVLNHAKHAAFLVVGRNKAQRLSGVLSDTQSHNLPAQAIRLESGKLEWLVDAGAASLL